MHYRVAAGGIHDPDDVGERRAIECLRNNAPESVIPHASHAAQAGEELPDFVLLRQRKTDYAVETPPDRRI